MAKPPKVTYRQEDGDDGRCYVVRVDGVERMNGLSQSEARYEKKRILTAHQRAEGGGE